ncbi:mucin-5AC-like [Rhagoletis pomonella]|uniref:mucin-5AC-like n=1 Tax=Rhagoletis pomonella TaxID=28610 RepID=UPI00177E2A5B|nr:mucin-5AC-like [Rhagoletis pomonella]
MEKSRERSPADAQEEKAHMYEQEEPPPDAQQQLSKQQHQHLLDTQPAKQQQEQHQTPTSHFVAEEETLGAVSASASEAAYEADVDDADMPIVASVSHKHAPAVEAAASLPLAHAGELTFSSKQRRQAERQHIYELFQPWALKNYGDQAKTKTITMRKKTRILKALEGKEHSRPDSSKFRFWVKTKAFTTKRPEDFEEAVGGHRKLEPLPPNAVLSDNPSKVDLFVGSTTKDFGKRTYRKVAVVEEFFDIIYNVHMELGGRSGMHAGQKRTYRIITETYAFLPREAVTRFLSICPECKKNLRAGSPVTSLNPMDEAGNESSSEVEGLTYSSHTESSLEAGPTKAVLTKSTSSNVAMPSTSSALKSSTRGTIGMPIKRRYSQLEETTSDTKFTPASQSLARTLLTAPKRQRSAVPPSHPRSSSTDTAVAATSTAAAPTITIDLVSESTSPLPSPLPLPSPTSTTTAERPKIRVNPQLQRPLTPPPVSATSALPSPSTLVVREPVTHAPPPYLGYHPLCFDMNFLKTHESFFRYYEMMRRFYAGGFPLPIPPLPAEFGGAEMVTSAQRSVVSAGVGPLAAAGGISTATSYAKQLSAATAPKQERLAANIESSSVRTEDVPAEEPLVKKFKSSPESQRGFRPRASTIESSTREVAEVVPQEAASTATSTAVAAELEIDVDAAVAAAVLPSLSPPPTQLSAINLSTSSTCRSSSRTNGASTSHAKPALATLTPLVIPTTPLTLSSSALSQLITSTPTARSSLKSSLSTALSEVKAAVTSGGAADTSSDTAASLRSSSSRLPPLDLERLKPITSTYLQLTRSMGLSDEDALRFDNLVSNDFNYKL